MGEWHIDFSTHCVIETLEGSGGLMLMTFRKKEKLSNVKVHEFSFTTKFFFESCYTLNKNCSFPLKISSVNFTKSAVPWGFGHIYWRNP